jgi:hypothetical protein
MGSMATLEPSTGDVPIGGVQWPVIHRALAAVAFVAADRRMGKLRQQQAYSRYKPAYLLPPPQSAFHFNTPGQKHEPDILF